MRCARITVDPETGDGYYHLISRTVNGEWMLGVTGKEVLRRMLWQVADFAGIEVLTYVILSNHFHVLVRVPKKSPLADEELLRRYLILYPKPTQYQPMTEQALRRMLTENDPAAQEWRSQLYRRMCNVSEFMKLVKERFSIWHNKTHHRYGPVWSDRFKSLIVEPKDHAVEALAAYIDLNCVRAGIVKDPKDYRFCGYAEAVAGTSAAREGIRKIVGGRSWAESQAAYRSLLFAIGSEPRESGAVIPRDRVREVFEQGGTLPLADVLRCRIRYFTQGAVLGSRSFVEAHLHQYRQQTGLGHRMKPRMLPAITDWGELAGLRGMRGCWFG